MKYNVDRNSRYMFFITLLLTKITALLIKLAGLGAGETWPGHLALKLFPSMLSDFRLRPLQGLIFISGTNGKTTTTKMIVHVLRAKGYRVVTNASGANLLNGIASALILGKSTFSAKRPDYAVLEVDEFTLPSALKQMLPDIVVLLNLSRDQLDRYGETDIIVERWEGSLNANKLQTVILDNSFDYFRSMSLPSVENILDSSGVGDNYIPPELLGKFHPKNIKASLTALGVLGILPEEASLLLSNFEAAYGRGEVVTSGALSFNIFLAKNPASMNENLKFFEKVTESYEALLFVLNDNIPDGRDVSWIYDIDPELIRKACHGLEIYVSGSRCYDMAVRLNYAGAVVLNENVSCSLQEVLALLRKKTFSKQIGVFPNYSAMLEFRKIIVGRKIL